MIRTVESTSERRLAVHVGRDVPETLSAVLLACTPWADVVTAAAQEPLPEGVQAHLYTSEVLPRQPSEPYALWLLADAPRNPHASLTVREVATGPLASADLHVCQQPWPASARPLLPFTRSRYRMLRALPSGMVVESVDGSLRWGTVGDDPEVASPATWPTLAALSSAVVATGDRVWQALAWAAPTVTDTATAQALALAAGEHVLVDDDPQHRRRLAAQLASDDILAARLARAGWCAVRDRRPERVAELLCSRLGLRRRNVAAASRLTSELDSLGTPHDSLIRRRVHEATAVLPGATTAGWWSAKRSER